MTDRSTGITTWSAPVRYAETDQQGIVFNSHYLLYCDEALGTFCAERGLGRFAELVRLKTSTQTWHSAATWGEVVDVDTSCAAVGRSSATMHFVIRVGDRVCVEVDTVYVLTDDAGVPHPIGDADRSRLSDPAPRAAQRG